MIVDCCECTWLHVLRVAVELIYLCVLAFPFRILARTFMLCDRGKKLIWSKPVGKRKRSLKQMEELHGGTGSMRSEADQLCQGIMANDNA